MGPHRRLSGDPKPTRRATLAAWAAGQVGHAEPGAIAAGAATALARLLDLPLDDPAAPSLIRERPTAGTSIEPPPGLITDAWDLGTVHEATLDAARRRSSGVHYTPRSVASGLARIALDAADSTTTVCDPAVGGGAFLLAAADVLSRAGATVDEVLCRLRGNDIDAVAVSVAGAALALWGAADGHWPDASPRLAVADTLDPGGSHRGDATSAQRVDVVIGNPPFQSQLASGTARDPAEVAELRRRWGTEAGPYCDTAGWFLLAALERAVPGGRIVLVLPQSLLASADAEPVRCAHGSSDDGHGALDR